MHWYYAQHTKFAASYGDCYFRAESQCPTPSSGLKA
ncbi:BQ5605_C014g07516 [Microbotryum silenes-dioicae]|uniref:BQ5605_C014g07516 protein n=1 Tax=Microbotryum silenes-dioicae TaxID=796604 RepID=A0A2X0NRH0_9BASI|nr:BQ5605_C014g07516 [Microbotryum silenes-dioicae]